MAEMLSFPSGFLWGSAVAAHQVEGGNTRNDWWLWEQTPGHIRHNHTSAVAADWWNRAEDDIALAGQLGHNALRVSLEWSRIEPREGEWDEAALARYRRQFEAMRRQGLEPMVCLFHFTLPQWVAGRGGFETTWAIDRFTRFVDRVAHEYKDLVRYWLTLNEPMVYVALGWFVGAWPPGKASLADAIKVARHLVHAHAQAYHVIHRHRPDAQVSVGMHVASYVPHNGESRLDHTVANLRDWLLNMVWLRATLEGVMRPPLGLNSRVGDAVDTHDFLGFQHYFTYPMAFSMRHAPNLFAREVVKMQPGAGGFMGEYRPEGLGFWATKLKTFGKPLIVTENGLLEVEERERPAYLLRVLSGLHDAIQDGADVRGYFHWSLIDNFEWAEGYEARFGLVQVDFDTQQRTVRPSGYLFRDIARANGITPHMAEVLAPDLLTSNFTKNNTIQV